MNIPGYWSRHLHDRYGEATENDDFRNIPASGDRLMVMVETRSDPLLPCVLRNFVCRLAPRGWGLLIFHGIRNAAFIRNIITPWNHVSLHNTGMTSLQAHQYNRLLCSPAFWAAIPAEHILLFQPDAYLRKDNIEDFMGYDYVGAPWKPFLNIVGNGGLSYRKKSAMLKCLAEVPYAPTHHLNRRDLVYQNEDKYFSITAGHLLHRPAADIAMQFSVETIYYPDPLGLHKPWMSLEEQLVRRLLETGG